MSTQLSTLHADEPAVVTFHSDVDSAVSAAAEKAAAAGGSSISSSAASLPGHEHRVALAKHATPITLTWSDVVMTVKAREQDKKKQPKQATSSAASSSSSSSGRVIEVKSEPVPSSPAPTAAAGTLTVLNRISGYALPGGVTAILGASGSGKTSLLNALSGRDRNITGQVLMNGRLPSRDLVQITAFVQQQDLYFKTLTVGEHLRFQARLRLPALSLEQREERVVSVMRELGLLKVEHTRIGEVGQGGISGGERRRLTFANEILTDPSLLFCDEPTSGLDSFMSEEVVSILHQMARAGRTIVCTIHAPSTAVFNSFDRVMFLSSGRVAFAGTQSEALAHFAAAGFTCPQYTNPADHIVATLSNVPTRPTESAQQIASLLERWSVSAGRRAIDATVERVNAEQTAAAASGSGSLSAAKGGVRVTASFCEQLAALTSRALISNVRNPILTKARAAQAIVLGLIVGLIYLRLDNDQKSVQNKSGAMFFVLINQCMSGTMGVLMTFPLELPIFHREFASNMYGSLPYYLSKMTADLPLQIAFPSLFASVVYWMVGFSDDFERFIYFLLIVLLTTNTAMSLGHLISAIANTPTVAMALTPLILMPLMLFGGLLVNNDSVPVYFIWLSHISFFKYGYEAISITEWRGRSIGCHIGEDCQFSSGEQVLKNLSMSEDNLGRNIGILFALFFGLRTLSYLFLHRRARSKASASWDS